MDKGSKAAGALNAAVLAFFKEASAVIQETTSGLHGDTNPTSIYFLHVLLPILTHFMKHLQEHNTIKDVISKLGLELRLGLELGLVHY